MLCSVSNLGDKQLEEVKVLEKELGRTLLAVSCFDIEPAELKDRELARIRDAEKRLGFALVAVK